MTPAQTEACVDAAALALDLPLHPDHRPGVLRFFALAAEFAAVIDAVPLEAHAESAVVFRPVVPHGEPV
ncbi:AtzG-like protein [Variovorax sp. RHLX14]|uniref:AtzG-like protein n=1 Tax=Variovorax sp. RHLX14 TaxID=1259731 RepID=UPI003F4878B9